MSNFITVTQFAEKHNVGRSNVLSFIEKGFIASVALKTSRRPYLIDEEFCVMKKTISDGIRSDVQLWYSSLLKEMSLASIVRLCILIGADVTNGYGRELLNSKLYNYKVTSVLAYKPDEKLFEIWKAMSWLVEVVAFIGSSDEEELRLYICDILNIPEPTVVLKKKKVYSATCSGCNKIRILMNKPKGKTGLCPSCTVKVLTTGNIKAEQDLKRYWYFCPTCSSVRAVVGRRKSAYCKDCIRKHDVKTVKKSRPKKKKKKARIVGGIDGKQKVVMPKPRSVDEQALAERAMIEEFYKNKKVTYL